MGAGELGSWGAGWLCRLGGSVLKGRDDIEGAAWV